MIGRGAQHLHEVPEMRAEGRKASQNGLLVADIGVDVVEDRDPRSRCNRRRNTGLYQRGKKPERLEQDCLSASIGPRNQQRTLTRRHLEVEWHNVDSLRDEKR